MRWGVLVAIFAVAFGIAGLVAAVSKMDFSAIRQPGKTEEAIRTRLVCIAIRRRTSREQIPLRPGYSQTNMSISAGRILYNNDCAVCHGPDGRNPSAIGRGLFPPAVALDSAPAQRYSDVELFSIIRDGIRFTGMPGFSGTETNDQIWSVIDFLRTLR